MAIEDEQLPWTGLLTTAQIARLKEAVPSFVVCPEFTGRFGAADEAGLVKIMGSSTDLYLAKKILNKWYAKATQMPSEKVKWWSDFVQEKGIQPVMSHDILDGLAHERWTAYVATYNRAVAARLQKSYHAKKKAAAIQAKKRDHQVARDLVGLSGQGEEKAGPSGSRREGTS